MTERATFSLDEEAFAFLQQEGGSNKSAFINDLLKREKRKKLQEAIAKANQEESVDADYQKELSAWETTLSDGLDNV